MDRTSPLSKSTGLEESASNTSPQDDIPEMVAKGQIPSSQNDIPAHGNDLTRLERSRDIPFIPSSFVYPALDEPTKQLRLVSFELVSSHQSESAPIRCTLQTSSLKEAAQGSYNVLSYCWGNSSLFKPIYVNGQLHHITSNLEAALRSVRDSPRNVCIWADALCINQADVVEKAFQVDMMASIFSSAALCIIWLGNTSTDLSMDPNVIYEPHAVQAFALLDCLARDEHYTPLGNKKEMSLGPLMNLQWWHRIWTVQEAVLPPHCILTCGQLSMPWTSVVRASHNFRNHHYNMCCSRAVASLKEFHRKIGEIEATRTESVSVKGINMVRTLQKFQDRGSWDPRDKVYGLLALGARQKSAVTVAAGLRADYSVDTQAAFLDMARRLTEHTKSLDILLRTREYDRVPGLPSWVPDWTARQDRHRGRELLRSHSWALHSASGRLNMNLGETNIFTDPRILQLSGVKVDDIAVVGEACEDPRAFSAPPEGSIVMNFPDRLWRRSIDRMYGNDAKYPVGTTSYGEAFMRVLALDCMEDSYDADGGIVNRRIGTEDVAACMREVQTFKQYSTYFISKMMNRRFFITNSGLIGTGPVDTSVGDFVFVLFGANFPLILRKPVSLPDELREKAAGLSCIYNFVGDSYVHGVMDGEYADQRREETVCLI